MFVFYHTPYGGQIIDGQSMYGYLEKHSPTRVSWETFRKHSSVLIQASYTPDRLKKLFPNSTFPDLCFTYSDLRYLTWEQMCGLCKGFGIVTPRTNSERRKALRDFIKENC